MQHPKIDAQRLWDTLMALAAIGATPAGGVCRLALSDEDRRARDQPVRWCEAVGCRVEVDAVGNLFARRAGAFIISPFVGRVDDTGVDGMNLIREIAQIYRTHGITTKVLSASIRHPRHIVDSALAGADIATCPFKVLEQSMKHPLTDRGIEQFLKDWAARQ